MNISNDVRGAMDIQAMVEDKVRDVMQWGGSVPLDPDENLIDLGIDSLKAILILYSIEEVGIEVPNELLEDCRTINHIVSHVTRLMEAG